MALTGRELNLQEGEAVELIKIGCAGWWWVTFYHDLVILIFGEDGGPPCDNGGMNL